MAFSENECYECNSNYISVNYQCKLKALSNCRNYAADPTLNTQKCLTCK